MSNLIIYGVYNYMIHIKIYTKNFTQNNYVLLFFKDHQFLNNLFSHLDL